MYKLVEGGVIRLSDGTFIPFPPLGYGGAEYLDWLAKGNTPEPADLVDDTVPIQAQIDELERTSLLNRGDRELDLVQIPLLAAQEAAQLNDGTTAEQILAVNIFYNKLLALDAQIRALREQLP